MTIVQSSAFARALALVKERPFGFTSRVLLAATALTLPLFFASLAFNALPWVTRLVESTGPEVSVFLPIGTSAKDIATTSASLATIEGVRSVRHLPRDQAWADLARRTGLTSASIERFNPLPDVLVARFAIQAETATVERATTAMRALAGVEAVRADIEWHRRLSALTRAIVATLGVLGALSAVLVLVVVLGAARGGPIDQRSEPVQLQSRSTTGPLGVRTSTYLGALILGLAAVLAMATVIGTMELLRPLFAAAGEAVGHPLTLLWPPLWAAMALVGLITFIGAAAGAFGEWRARGQ